MAIRRISVLPLDVRNLSEFITTQVRDNGRISQFIMREDPLLRAALRGHYASGDTDLLSQDGVWNGPVQLPYPYTDQTSGTVVENSGSCVLSDITPDATAVTELWEIVYTSDSAYSVYGTISGTKTSGDIDTDYDNGLIAIPKENWSGTPDAGDAFYVATYRWDPLIVAISAKRAAALAIASIYSGASEEMAASGNRLKKDADDMIARLQRPYADDGLRLGTFSLRDVSPEGLARAVDMFGRDLTSYADNSRTPWDDSASYSSLIDCILGPAW